jgi:CheY-like chemotaxis protein
LLQRGIDQTAILYDFSRDGDGESASQSPLLLANKVSLLLNSISRVHRFVVYSQIDQEKIVCNIRDMILVLFYLGENCVDATPEGGEITLTVCREDNPEPGLSFCFRDHGPGFAEEQTAAQGTGFLSTSGDSAIRGLGLYAAQILAGRHRGRLSITRHHHTTLVSAVFPPAVEGKKALPAAETSPRQKGNALAKQCFLVVEDDEAMRTLLLNRLQRRGHMVFCVDTCAEAVEEYDHLHDIITTVVMDVGLRDASGYECHRKLLAINPQARIIFMSGQHEMAPREFTGKSVFLHKPFTLDQLEKAVHDVHL